MLSQEHVALDWFKYALGLDGTFRLYTLIEGIRDHGAHSLYYHYWKHSSSDGHGRLIVVPEPSLMFIHDRIKAFVKAEFDRKPWSFGFMGGSPEEAAHCHVKSRSHLRFDVRHAFFQVEHIEVLESLSEKPVFGIRHYGSISKWVARFIADLCTITSWPEVADRYSRGREFTFLPQGAPTSPILFDIACGKFDKKLVRIAERVGGVFTRFADNVVFSMPDRKFPPKLRRAILREAAERFPIHKVRQSNDGEPFHMLGLQIADYKVKMTRDYKRRLRGSLYHLQYAARQDALDDRTVNIARGRLSFAVSGDMSPSLISASTAADEIFQKFRT